MTDEQLAAVQQVTDEWMANIRRQAAERCFQDSTPEAFKIVLLLPDGTIATVNQKELDAFSPLKVGEPL